MSAELSDKCRGKVTGARQAVKEAGKQVCEIAKNREVEALQSGRETHGRLGNTEDRAGCQLVAEEHHQCSQKPYPFLDDLYRPSRIQGPEKVQVNQVLGA